MSKQNWYSAGAVILVVILASWLSYNKPKTQTQENTQNQELPTEQKMPEPVKISPNRLSGTLKTSDNKTKGQYSLQTEKYEIFIRTQRNFDILVGKKVSVVYEGTLENFKLGDILLAPEK